MPVWLADSCSPLATTWNAADALVRTITGHDGGVRAVAIAPDGTWLATAGGDRTARTWNADGTPRAAVIRVRGTISDCAWSPEGSDLYIARGRGLYRFTLRPPNE
jgi:WD40 repeat protein